MPTRVTTPIWTVNGATIERTNTVQDLQLGTSATNYFSVTQNGFEAVDILGGGGQDKFRIHSSLAGQDLTAFGWAGADEMIVDSAGIDGIAGEVSFEGGTDLDRLYVSD